MSSRWSIIASVTTATKRNGTRAGGDVASTTWSLLQDLVFSQRPRWIAVIRQYDLIPPQWIEFRRAPPNPATPARQPARRAAGPPPPHRGSAPASTALRPPR